MEYKSILVHLNDMKNTANLLKSADLLARRWDSHLTGLFVLPPVAMPVSPEMAFREDIWETHRTIWHDEADKVRQSFETVTNGAPYASDWRLLDAGTSPVASMVAEQARTADLAIVSQPEPGGGSEMPGTPQQAILESGRPVLVIPAVGQFDSIGRNVLVAWNGQKEAARAVFDALPLLKGADQVHILTVDPPNESKPVEIPGADIAIALARHGVSCETAKFVVGDVPVGDTLLNYVSDHDIDLIVMGCYGHTRLREFIFGGASRKVLSQATAPVLMSH